MTFYDCDNIRCGREQIPADKVVWVAETYTVCCAECKQQFLADNTPLVEQHLRILGADVPQTRETMLKLAAIVL